MSSKLKKRWQEMNAVEKFDNFIWCPSWIVFSLVYTSVLFFNQNWLGVAYGVVIILLECSIVYFLWPTKYSDNTHKDND